MAVLPLDDETAVLGDGDDIDPVGVFEDVELGIDVAVGQLYLVPAGGEPRAAEEVLALEHSPSLVIHVFVRVGIHDSMCVFLDIIVPMWPLSVPG